MFGDPRSHAGSLICRNAMPDPIADKETLFRVSEIVTHAETERSQEVHAHDKEYEIFQFAPSR